MIYIYLLSVLKVLSHEDSKEDYNGDYERDYNGALVK